MQKSPVFAKPVEDGRQTNEGKIPEIGENIPIYLRFAEESPQPGEMHQTR